MHLRASRVSGVYIDRTENNRRSRDDDSVILCARARARFVVLSLLGRITKSYLPRARVRARLGAAKLWKNQSLSLRAEPVSVQFICMGIAPHGDGCTPVSILSGPPVPSASCLVFSRTEATRSRASAAVETSSMDFARAPNPPRPHRVAVFPRD